MHGGLCRRCSACTTIHSDMGTPRIQGAHKTAQPNMPRSSAKHTEKEAERRPAALAKRQCAFSGPREIIQREHINTSQVDSENFPPKAIGCIPNGMRPHSKSGLYFSMLPQEKIPPPPAPQHQQCQVSRFEGSCQSKKSAQKTHQGVAPHRTARRWAELRQAWLQRQRQRQVRQGRQGHQQRRLCARAAFGAWFHRLPSQRTRENPGKIIWSNLCSCRSVPVFSGPKNSPVVPIIPCNSPLLRYNSPIIPPLLAER